VRRIDKERILSTSYKQWHDGMETANRSHPVYTSQHDFYLDVVMNLFHCQGGLCAYTEVLLCPPSECEACKWEQGRYPPPRPEFDGNLEHFDSTLKREKGWLWANLFMVHSDTNRRKGQRAVDVILKPDAEDYDPFRKLEYDVSRHVFIPNSLLSEDLSNRVNNMILILGLNHGTVRQHRVNLLSELLKAIEFGVETWDSTSPAEFPTAFAMVRDQLNA
jgi:hypothetical protein